MSSQNSNKNTHAIIEQETKNMLQIIKLRELYRYKNVLVHYRYDFTPKQECSIAELSWGFVKDPWFADAVATNVAKYLPDIRDEPPVFVQEWNDLSTKDEGKVTQHATMEVTQETTIVSNDCQNDDLPPPLVNFDDMPPLELVTSEDDSSWDDSSSLDDESESYDSSSEDDSKPEPLVTSVSFNSLMKELDEIVIDVTWQKQTVEQKNEVKDYEAEIEKIYTQYLLSKYENDAINRESRKQLDESIAELHRTANLQTVNVEKYHVAENMNTYEIVRMEQPVEHVAVYENIVMPIPQRAILNPMSDDDVFVRVFTVQDLKWNGGADLVDPMKLPTNQCFKMPKTSTWEESVWEEIGYRTNIFDDSPVQTWTPYVFSKRANGTIRPSFIIDDYVPLSVYQKNLNVRNEVWILLLNTREPRENEVIIHKKWYHKGWFYYQGFEIVDKSAILSSIMNYDIAFEEVCSIGNRSNMVVESLNPSSTIKSLGLSNGDIIVCTKMSHYIGPRGTPELINSECIIDAFDMIENLRPELLKQGKLKFD